MSEKDKIEELEKKLDETRKILDDLVYHFMLRIDYEETPVFNYPTEEEELLKTFRERLEKIRSERDMYWSQNKENEQIMDLIKDLIINSSELLKPIFDEIKEKKDLKVEQLIKENIKFQKEKSDEIEQKQKIEKQRKTEKLEKIREKKAELERLKKGL